MAKINAKYYIYNLSKFPTTYRVKNVLKKYFFRIPALAEFIFQKANQF